MQNTMKILISLSLILSSTNAFAAGCSCGSVTAIVATYASQTTSNVNANTNLQAEMLKVEINTAATNIIGTLQTQSKSIIAALQLLKEDFHRTIEATSIAEQLVHVEEMFGEASQPDSLCGGSNLGAGLQVSAQASDSLMTGFTQNQIEFNNNPDARQVDFINRIISPEHPSIEEMVESLSPSNFTLTPEQVAQANEAIKTIATPFPLPLLTDEQLNSPAGEGYEIERIREQSMQGLAMSALNGNVAYHAPTVPDDLTAWAQEEWQRAGGTGEVPGLVDGSMSESGLFALLSKLRSGNPNWIAEIQVMTNMGVAREQLMIDALNFEIQRKNNELLNQLVMLASLQYLQAIEENGTASEVYQEFIANEQ